MRVLLATVILLGSLVAPACRDEGGEPCEVLAELGLALDNAAYVYGVDNSITVYGSGFVCDEYVLPEILGTNPRGFRAEGVNADARGAFSTTIALLTGGNSVQPGVYTIRVTGDEGTMATIPMVIVTVR